MLGYKSNNNVVYSSKYHVIWCPKYRRKVLVGDIAKRLEELMRKTALKYRADLIALEIMPDPVPVLCEVDPPFGIHRFVKNSKGVTSGHLRKQFVSLRRRLASLWTKSFSSMWRIKRMSDEYITPTALGAERNGSRSKVALLGPPDQTFRMAGLGGKTGSLFAMSAS